MRMGGEVTGAKAPIVKCRLVLSQGPGARGAARGLVGSGGCGAAKPGLLRRWAGHGRGIGDFYCTI